jgi:WD40 repeat protein
MNRAIFILALLVLPATGFPQGKATQQPAGKPFPEPDFILRDTGSKMQKGGLVMGPMESDGKGGTKGSFAINGGSSMNQVRSLSFSGDGKILAVGSAPPRVDIWDVDNRKKLHTFDGGFVVALSSDAHLLATNTNGIEIRDVATGNIIRTIPWSLASPMPGAQRVIRQMWFDPSGNLLLVSSNGGEDEVFGVASGQLVATLTHTQQGQFSRDGAFVVSGNGKQLIEWSTKNWTQISEAPNGADLVMQIASFPEKDLAIVGGLKGARLVHISSGEEIAKVGEGFTNFAAFNRDGTLVLTDSGDSFGIWDTAGKRYCYKQDFSNGTDGLSGDGRWLAAGMMDGGTSVAIWNLKSALSVCGAP